MDGSGGVGEVGDDGGGDREEKVKGGKGENEQGGEVMDGG